MAWQVQAGGNGGGGQRGKKAPVGRRALHEVGAPAASPERSRESLQRNQDNAAAAVDRLGTCW